MDISSIDDEWELPYSSNEVRTVVLVGRTGSGKSATGNSILGRKAFMSRPSASGVTSTCELQTTLLEDGQVVNVIDTPGLFDFTVDCDYIGKEIANCFNLAKDGIDAVLVVFSLRNRFTKEEEAAFKSLHAIFGDKIKDYMIVVFTAGDDLEDNNECLEGYLGCDCPEPLKEVLRLCKYRRAVFDNKTKDESKKADQLLTLLDLVNEIVAENGGQPYSYEFFLEPKKEAVESDLCHSTEQLEPLKESCKEEMPELKEQTHNSNEERVKRLTEMFEEKIVETARKLEQKVVELAEQQAAQLKLEHIAQEAQIKSDEDIRQLRESLERAQKETEELRKKAELKNEDLLKQQENESVPILDKLRETFEKAQKETKQFGRRAQRETEELCKKAQRKTAELRESGHCIIL